MPKQNKIVIFDFDGVIVDTFGFCYVIRNNVSPLTENEYRINFEGNINEEMKKVKVSIPNYWEKYTPQLMECKPHEGIVEVIESLSKKYTLAIVSSTTSLPIKSFLEKFDLLKYFQEILGNDVDHSKVKKLQMVLEKHEVSPRDVIFITDTLGDIKEGKVCGIESLAVTWGYHLRETLIRGNPYKIATTPNELLQSIEEYLK